MKADPCGGYTEQMRFKMGWKSPTQLKGIGSAQRCSSCKYFHLKRIVKADESIDFSPYCKHVMTAGGDEGHATREKASCDKWESKQ